MGCDIHVCIEARVETTWRSVDHFIPSPYAGGPEYELVSVYTDRNYALFSALADVRSPGRELPLLAPARGFPEDASQYTRREYENWGMDAHTPSHCTLQELYDYQAKNKSVTFTGMISPEQAESLDQEGQTPTAWCAWTNQKNWVTRTWTVEYDVMEELISAVERRGREIWWIWDETKPLTPEQAANLRIVFWFDN